VRRQPASIGGATDGPTAPSANAPKISKLAAGRDGDHEDLRCLRPAQYIRRQREEQVGGSIDERIPAFKPTYGEESSKWVSGSSLAIDLQ
jgi:hypothetical protein